MPATLPSSDTFTPLLDDVSLARTDNPTNAAILSVSEDRLQGFSLDPFADIAHLTELPYETVTDALRRMLRAGTIRRIRQTLNTTTLASGALIAWKVAPENVDSAFDYLFKVDPFSGHVVVRSTDGATPGAGYRLWTTLKVPQGFSVEKHVEFLKNKIGATSVRVMPAKAFFVLGVGHVRRRDLEPGDKTDTLADMTQNKVQTLTDNEWNALDVLKRELDEDEIGPNLWKNRAKAAGLDFDAFVETARALEARGILGRFSTFLEHVKPTQADERVTRYNALFHWRVPVGMEEKAGREVGRFYCMTHAYWRDGGEDFANVNIMGVAHGQEKPKVLAHKAAMDAHLNSVGIPVLYTNVFWGGRSEIKPSEILPAAYEQFCADNGLDANAMRQE